MIEEIISNTSTNRLTGVTEKIGRERTGLKGAIYVHVDFDSGNRPNAVSFSWRNKDGCEIDKVLVALGDAVTAILRDGPV
jgi:hypothetical protein